MPQELQRFEEIHDFQTSAAPLSADLFGNGFLKSLDGRERNTRVASIAQPSSDLVDHSNLIPKTMEEERKAGERNIRVEDSEEVSTERQVRDQPPTVGYEDTQ